MPRRPPPGFATATEDGDFLNGSPTASAKAAIRGGKSRMRPCTWGRYSSPVRSGRQCLKARSRGDTRETIPKKRNPEKAVYKSSFFFKALVTPALFSWALETSQLPATQPFSTQPGTPPQAAQGERTGCTGSRALPASRAGRGAFTRARAAAAAGLTDACSGAFDAALRSAAVPGPF